jgi:hypothetical protein
VELDGTDLKMKANEFTGYEFDVSVNCDTIDGSLIRSPGGKVCRKRKGKGLS